MKESLFLLTAVDGARAVFNNPELTTNNVTRCCKEPPRTPLAPDEVLAYVPIAACWVAVYKQFDKRKEIKPCSNHTPR